MVFTCFKISRKFLPVFFLYAEYSGRCRPACRKSHTGVRSTCSLFAARIIRSLAGGPLGRSATVVIKSVFSRKNGVRTNLNFFFKIKKTITNRTTTTTSVRKKKLGTARCDWRRKLLQAKGRVNDVFWSSWWCWWHLYIGSGWRILWERSKKSTSPTAHKGMCNFTPKHYFSQNIDPFLQ